MATRPHHLRTAYARAPLGVDETEPTLRWRLDADRRGASQTACRVLVASSPDRLDPESADVWDSGWRETDRPALRYDGPALEACRRYHWAVRLRDERDEPTAWSDPTTFETGPLGPEDWSAAWIRRDVDEFERGHVSYLRRGIHLDGEVERARADVAACHQYALSVNGTEVDRGPAFAYPDAGYYRTVDLTEHLQEGRNALGALHVWNAGGQGRPAGEPGFCCQVRVTFADGSERVVGTDEAWRVREAPWLDADLRNGEIAEPVEVIDARDVPDGWASPGFDDDGWSRPDVAGDHPTEPWTALQAQVRDVVTERVDPESVERLDDGTLVADFGRVYSAVPLVEFGDGADGRRVDMCAGYRRDEDGRVSRTRGTQTTDMSYGLVQRDGAQTFRPFNYLGIRYFEVEDPDRALDVADISLLARHADVPDAHAGTFESDDDTLDDVFEMARHSALYGSQEQFVDTPTREKGQFLMDGFNISQVTTRAFGERLLSRAAIREFLQSHYRYWAAEGRANAVYPNDDGKRDIPDFTVNLAEWAWRYYRESGDRRILEEAYPVLKAVGDYVHRNVDEETGLVTELAGGVGGPYHQGIVDWPDEMRYGYDRDWPARTTVNALCANALRRTARIGAELDRPAVERRHYRERGDAIAAALDEHLRDGEVYVDGGDGEAASDHASQHASAVPLALDVAPAELTDSLADHVADQGMAMGPMMVQFCCEALERAGRTEALLELFTDAGQDGWADILSREETSFFTWETWHARSDDVTVGGGRQNRSESHAMGATVLVSIQRALLGVRLAEPGGARVVVEPPSAGLDRASGTVPTERGPVDVAWSREDGLSVDVTVPANAAATVRLPVDGRDVRLGSRTLSSGGDQPTGVRRVERDDGDVVVEVGAGAYAFEAT